MRGHLKYITQRLSLRTPQSEALGKLARLLDQIGLPAQGEVDFESLIGEFPQLKEFERDFPNVCFSLATGVGKTRLMGAMIAYLFLSKRVRNFLIFAPNNTILEKLMKDFSDPTHSKYVFRGIAEFAVKAPKIITADDFELMSGGREDDQDVHINIFNIAKMHTDKRKIKKWGEYNNYCGMSYFDYLASLEDLVVMMDEAHRYRAGAAMKTIQDLKPLLGLEFTATPQIAKGSVRFKNILYDYPLSLALKDGYLKEPAVAGRENFDRKNYSSEEELDRLKIEDGVILHEQTKVHLLTYADERGLKAVKPLMLIVAKDTKHANQIKQFIESDEFFEGSYLDKVLVVHSEVKAEAQEQMVSDLLEVENAENPIEIVIHVNMLREGWDIVNLYTMVPLRKANSKTLIEQNLGRGLRLPFGRLTGIKEIDTHTVVSHDRFNEIIDAANHEESVIRRGVVIGKDVSLEPLGIVEVSPRERLEVENIEDVEKREITLKAYEAIHYLGLETREEIVQYVNKERSDSDCSDVELIIDDFLKSHREKAIYIPRIRVQPRVVRRGRFLPFKLELSHIALKPFGEGIIVQGLSKGERTVYEAKGSQSQEKGVENQLMMHLMDFDEVAENEENITVVRECSDQMVRHLQGYLKDDTQVTQVVRQQGVHLAKVIHTQMLNHFEEPAIEWDTEVAEKLVSLRTMRLPVPRGSRVRHFSKPVDDKLKIREMVFEGYTKSLYPLVKFDSDSERIFSVILEQDSVVKKWVKPARGVFSFINYSKDSCYEPDFIVETDESMFLCEIKRRSDLETPDVLSKAEAAFHWCHLATRYALEKNTKPWSYLLIPHDELRLSKTFEGLVVGHNYLSNKGK